jgi:hypothetical protein
MGRQKVWTLGLFAGLHRNVAADMVERLPRGRHSKCHYPIALFQTRSTPINAQEALPLPLMAE